MAWKTWAGGRKWIARDGRVTYYIRRKIGARLYQINTRCHEERAAIVHLVEFEKDPRSYEARAVHRDPVPLDHPLIEEYAAAGLTEKGNTPEWGHQARCVLRWWRGALWTAAGPGDLRGVRKEAFEAMLRRTPNAIGKVKHLRAFYGWLRRTKRITDQDDEARLLRPPPGRPAQWSRQRHVERADIARVAKLLREPHRSALLVLASTGMHAVELTRVCRDGRVIERHGQPALVIPWTKAGGSHTVAVTPRVARMAQFLIESHHGLSHKVVDLEVREAQRKIPGMVPFGLGSLRHSFATFAMERGSPIEAVAAALHHRSFSTTKRFYTVLGVIPHVASMW